MIMDYNRYEKFTSGSTYINIPFIKIRERGTDQFISYNPNERLDAISQRFYSDPRFGWLILQANPTLSSIEEDIPRNSTIRIPYPLEQAIVDYESVVNTFLRNGN